MTTDTAVLMAAGLATLGWLYTGRRARTLSRKQHTINILTQASFNKDWRDAMERISPILKDKKLPDLAAEPNGANAGAIRMVLNHYEFIAAGLRNGDFDESLVRDSQRGTILTLVEVCGPHIYNLRNSRQRQSVYEHIEWLSSRWTTNKPGWVRRCAEWCRGRPFSGRRNGVD